MTPDDPSPIPSPPDRPDVAHKGTFGTVVVLAGSPRMLGAPALVARAALRAGAGLVHLAVPPAILPHVLTIEPSATGLDGPWPFNAAKHPAPNGDPTRAPAYAVGPSLGTTDPPGFTWLIPDTDRWVLDADGLNRLAAHLHTTNDPGWTHPPVLTPHPGEFRRLAQPLGITHDPTDPVQRPDAARALAHALGCVVLLKGHRTVLTDGEAVHLNHTGTPALATAGSGDVLTGLIAALLAQGMPPLDAARLAAHAHGRAAEQWTTQHGPRGLRAQDLADRLPDALHTR